MENIAETIRQNLGYAALYKIDPNTQDISLEDKSFGTNSLTQAAIPVVVTGLFNYLSQPALDSAILLGNEKWLPMIFGKKLTEVTGRVAEYAGASGERAKGEMEHIADEAVRLVNTQITGSNRQVALSEFLSKHKDDALFYLPASLKTGEMLGDNTIDDRTHKMEGPISSFMHKLEKQF